MHVDKVVHNACITHGDVHYSSATTHLIGQTTKLLEILAEPLNTSFVLRALYEIQLPGKQLSLAAPLRVDETLALVVPRLYLDWLSDKGKVGWVVHG